MDLILNTRTSLIDTEKKILNLIINQPSQVDEIISNLVIDDFSVEKHRALFSLILNLYKSHREVNEEIIRDELEKNKVTLNKIGGLSYLMDILYEISLPSAQTTYLSSLKEASRLRNLKQELQRSLQEIDNPDKRALDIIVEIENHIFSLTQQYKATTNFDIQSLTDDYIQKLEMAKKGKVITGIETSFPKLDKITGGFQNGNLIILAARPSMGKTAFAIDLTLKISDSSNIPVGLFSLEMPNDQIVHRMISSTSTISSSKIREASNLSSQEWSKIYIAKDYLREKHKIFIDDSPGLTLNDIIWRARRWVSIHDVKIIFIDYLQLIASKDKRFSESRQQEVSDISRTLKSLARELDIPIVALSQLSRRVEQREEKRPIMSDIRESGAIEQDADLIMFLFREDYYKKSSDQEKNDIQTVELLISKHRNGPTGIVNYKFDMTTGLFIQSGEV